MCQLPPVTVILTVALVQIQLLILIQVQMILIQAQIQILIWTEILTETLFILDLLIIAVVRGMASLARVSEVGLEADLVVGLEVVSEVEGVMAQNLVI